MFSLCSEICIRTNVLLKILISGLRANFTCGEYMTEEINLTSFPTSLYSLSLIMSYGSGNSALQNESVFLFKEGFLRLD